jgi:hypothetical protein
MSLEIIKRLEIINNAIAIEEDDLIAMQLIKLKSFVLDQQAQKIVDLIEARHFEMVSQLIHQYKQSHHGMVLFEDEATQGLRYELKLLENNLNSLTEEKNEYERQLHEFNAEYVLRLGGLIEQILCLRFRHYAKIVVDHPEFSSEAEYAQQTYESFKQNSEQQLQDLPNPLTEEQKKELKSLYRRASRLSHPDVVSDEFKQQGEEIFKTLNEAYRQQNLIRVKEIIFALESRKSFGMASDTVNDKALLRQKIDLLRAHIEKIELEINTIKEDDTFRELQKISDWENYFNRLTEQLESELNQLSKN